MLVVGGAVAVVLAVWALAVWLLVGGIAVGTRPGHPRPEQPSVGADVSETGEPRPGS
jgi:hypothetical protein